MKKTHFKLALTAAIGGVLMLSGVTTASAANPVREATPTLDNGQPHVSSVQEADTSGMYLVRLAEPPVATYDGGIIGLQATSAQATGKKRLDTKSQAAKKYKNHLKQRQNDVLENAGNAFGRDLNAQRTYQWATNGFAAVMTADEANALRGMAGVASVERERMEKLLTDAGPSWIGAPKIWNNKPVGTRGEGVVVAILDSGINSDHPSFADVGGDGYDHDNPLGSGTYVLGSHCDVVDPSFCNDKLIGAWDFDLTPSDGDTPEDDDGHGSHTASTAAGNVVKGAELIAPTTTASFDISGVAPHANIIAYDVCHWTPSGGTCPGGALVAAIDQVLVDAGNLPNGIAALNYSISGGGNPYNDTVELGFLAAVQAGVYVAASAGNSGPDASTVAHLGPWVSTTAASTHDREIANSLIDLTSDGGGASDISGLGLTSGYGPAPIINSADLEGAFPGSTLCGLGSIGDNIPPWPPGTFNGEIVACTRGTFGRVEKGANALAAGAGGYVLMDNGGGLVADGHVLPGVHISQADGATLSAWLAANAGNNPMASIEGWSFNFDPAAGDVMAGFSSRGPQLAFDSLKPDITAPGVNIMGADSDVFAQYQIISGTSMSSPHNAGSGALMTAMRPDLSPQEIKSAIMMSSTTANTVKEDGFTPTDPFDLGAGRIDLGAAKVAGLVMFESYDNFMDANPELGGDPSTLNVASMMDSNCVGTCSWTREVWNPERSSSHWNVTTAAPAGVVLASEVTPEANSDAYNLKLKKNQSATITVTADTALAPEGWYFGTLDFDRNLGKGPDLNMPIAVYASKATNSNLFTKSVDADTAASGDILSYEINIINGPVDGEISLVDMAPDGATLLPGSESATVTNGVTTEAVAIIDDVLTWKGVLDRGGVDVVLDPWDPANGLFGGSPFGYLDLPGSFGVGPLPCSSVCDDTSITLNGLPPFVFDGAVYTDLVMGSNGIIIPGTDTTNAFANANQDFPDPTAPNAIAPFWTDLDLDGTSDTDTGAGHWYAAVFNSGAFTVLEWQGVEVWNVPGVAYTFQIQIGNVGSGYEGIWFTYAQLDGTPGNLTVGAENATGTAGGNYYYNGAGTFPATGGPNELKVIELTGGTATINFQAEADCSVDTIVNEAEMSHDDGGERAIAVTSCP